MRPYGSPFPPREGDWGGRIALALLIVCAAIAFWSASPFPPARGFDYARFRDDQTHQRAVAAAIARIPPDASVSAQTGLAPHLAHRATLSEFPEGIGAAYVLLDTHGDIARPYQSLYFPFAAMLPDEGYTVLWSRDGVMLYWRNG
jgi:hypothetical protein